MKQSSKERIVILSISFVLFIGGMAALSMESGEVRRIILTVILITLAAIALRQTFQKYRKDKEQ